MNLTLFKTAFCEFNDQFSVLNGFVYDAVCFVAESLAVYMDLKTCALSCRDKSTNVSGLVITYRPYIITQRPARFNSRR